MTSIIKTNKSVIYCRVSSREQEDTGYSLPAQEKLLQEYAQKKDFKISRNFSISESASGKYQRKTFDEMLSYLVKNKIKIIICEKVDRLTRNLKDAVSINDWLNEDSERQVHFVKENCILNKDSKSNDKFIWNIKISTAQYYIDNLSEEVKKGQKEKISQGWLPQKPPLGYKTIGERGHKIHIIDDFVAPHLRRMFELYATGNYSLSRIEKELYEAGLRSRSGKMLGVSRIHLLLQNPFYCGKISWNEQVYNGKHEPIIKKDVFDKVQILIKRKTLNPHLAKHNPLFKSKIFCSNCGGMLTWYEKKGHWYGHCNNHGEYRKCVKKTCIRQDRVEEQYADIFNIVAPKNKEVLFEIEKIIKEEYSQKVSEREKEVQKLNGLLFNVRKQKDKYFEAKIDKEVPLDFCERKIAELIREEEDLETALTRANDESDEELQIGLAVHELAYKSKDIYEIATNDEKRLLLSQLFTNLIQNEYEIEPKLTPAIEFLKKWMPILNNNFYEPQKSVNLGTKNPLLGGFDACQITRLRCLDSNQEPTPYTLSLCYHWGWTISLP